MIFEKLATKYVLYLCRNTYAVYTKHFPFYTNALVLSIVVGAKETFYLRRRDKKRRGELLLRLIVCTAL